MMPGAPPMSPMAGAAGGPVQGVDDEAGQTVSIDAVVAFLKNQKLRAFRIDVETDALIEQDDQQDKQKAIEFIQAIAQFFQGFMPVVEQAPTLAPMAGELLTFAVRRFRVGRELEETIEEAMQKAGMMLQQKAESGAQPDPSEQIKLQAAQVKAQAEQQKAQTDAQAAAQAHQMDLQAQQAKTQGDLEAQAQKHQQGLEQAAQQHDLAQAALVAQHQREIEKKDREVMLMERKHAMELEKLAKAVEHDAQKHNMALEHDSAKHEMTLESADASAGEKGKDGKKRSGPLSKGLEQLREQIKALEEANAGKKRKFKFVRGKDGRIEGAEEH